MYLRKTGTYYDGLEIFTSILLYEKSPVPYGAFYFMRFRHGRAKVSNHCQRHVDIAACGVGVWADDVRLVHQIFGNRALDARQVHFQIGL